MNRALLLGAFALFAMCHVSVAQMDVVASMDIKAIKSMRFEDAGNKLVCKSGIVFVNSSEKEAKLRNAEFQTSFKSADGEIFLGTGKLAELVLPAGKADAPAELEQEMTIEVGPKNDDTYGRLIAIFNLIGDPAANFTLLLNGTSEVGAKTEKGWIYQKGIGVELEFTPSIQREVLFK